MACISLYVYICIVHIIFSAQVPTLSIKHGPPLYDALKQIELIRLHEEEERKRNTLSSSSSSSSNANTGGSGSSATKVVRNSLPARKQNLETGKGGGRNEGENRNSSPLQEQSTTGVDAASGRNEGFTRSSTGHESSATVREMYFPKSGDDNEAPQEPEREKPPALIGVGGVPVMDFDWVSTTKKEPSPSLLPRLRGTAVAREEEDGVRGRHLGEAGAKQEGGASKEGEGKKTRKYIVDDDNDRTQDDITSSSSNSGSGSGSSSTSRSSSGSSKSGSAAVFTRESRRDTRRGEAAIALASEEGRDMPAASTTTATVGDNADRDRDGDRYGSVVSSGVDSSSSHSSTSGSTTTKISGAGSNRNEEAKDPSDDVAAPFAASPAAVAAVGVGVCATLQL